MANFDIAFESLVRNEGTRSIGDSSMCRYGVSVAGLSAWRRISATPIEVAALTLEDARQYYLEMFWGKLCGDSIIEQARANAILGLSVMVGIFQGIRMAQWAAGDASDGYMSSRSTRAINSAENDNFFRGLERAAQAHFLSIAHRNPETQKYFAAWLQRLDRLVRPRQDDAP